MKIVFKGWDDIDKIIQQGLPLFMRRRDGDIAPYRHYALPLPPRLARGGSPPRPTAITPAHSARAVRMRITWATR